MANMARWCCCGEVECVSQLEVTISGVDAGLCGCMGNAGGGAAGNSYQAKNFTADGTYTVSLDAVSSEVGPNCVYRLNAAGFVQVDRHFGFSGLCLDPVFATTDHNLNLIVNTDKATGKIQSVVFAGTTGSINARAFVSGSPPFDLGASISNSLVCSTPGNGDLPIKCSSTGTAVVTLP